MAKPCKENAELLIDHAVSAGALSSLPALSTALYSIVILQAQRARREKLFDLQFCRDQPLLVGKID